MLAATCFAAVSCSPDYEGTDPGSDGAPKATLYTYTPTSADGDYAADTDIRLRIAANSQTTTAYYKAIKTDVYETMSQADVISEVIETGSSVQDLGDGKDVFLTGLQGSWTLAVVASNGSSNTLSTTDFYGKTWNTVSTGTVYTRFAAGDDSWSYGYIYDVELQQDADDTYSYRLKNPYGTKINLSINVQEEAGEDNPEYDEDGYAYEGADDYFSIDKKFRYVLIPKTAIGLTYTGYGEVSYGDYYSVRGSDYTYYCRIYEDNSIRVYGYWTGAANMGSGWLYFYPD